MAIYTTIEIEITRKEAEAAIQWLLMDGDVSLDEHVSSGLITYRDHLVASLRCMAGMAGAETRVDSRDRAAALRYCGDEVCRRHAVSLARRIAAEHLSDPEHEHEQTLAIARRISAASSDSAVADVLRERLDQHMREHGDPQEGVPADRYTSVALEWMY